MSNTNLVAPSLDELIEINTVLVYDALPSRKSVFLLICVTWSLTVLLGYWIGSNHMSEAVAFKAGALPFLIFLVLFLGYALFANSKIRSKSKSYYSQSEIDSFIKREDKIIDFSELNKFSAIGFSILGYDYARKLSRGSFAGRDEKEFAAIFYFLFFFRLHILYVIMAPHLLGKACAQLKQKGYGKFGWQVFKGNWFWLPIFYIAVVFGASLFGATAIDFTK
jgi:hypothetical protein